MRCILMYQKSIIPEKAYDSYCSNELTLPLYTTTDDQ